MSAQMATIINVGILRGQNGKVLEVQFKHHPGIPFVRSIMENAIKGVGRKTNLNVIDGIMVFSCDDNHVPVVAEQKGVLRELLDEIEAGRACLMPLRDGFFEGIRIGVGHY